MLDFKFITDVKSQDEKLKEIISAVKKLNNTDVLVGIPADESGRDNGGSVNNAELLYIHTHGSALKNIPPRPVIEPAIENDKEIIGGILTDAAKAALNGDTAGIDISLEKAGMQGQNSARAWFNNPKNAWKPNAQETKNRKGSEKPLIDTGEMRKSITYVVREK
jgi:hypothetical protein